MGITEWIKTSILGEKPTIKNNNPEAEYFSQFSKNKFLNRQWMNHYFMFKITRPKNMSEGDFWVLKEGAIKEKIFGIVIGQENAIDSWQIDKTRTIFKGSLRKNVTIKITPTENREFNVLIRFINMTKKDLKLKENGMIMREKSERDKRSYYFSPIQSIVAQRILSNIELGLVALFGLQLYENTTRFGFESKEPIVTQFDGLQYLSYSLKERAELYKKYPEIHNRLFKIDFWKFIQWIMDKREHDEYMKVYCTTVDKMLKSLKLVKK